MSDETRPFHRFERQVVAGQRCFFPRAPVFAYLKAQSSSADLPKIEDQPIGK
jgi:hypothetical protein